MNLITVQEYRDITRDINTPASEVSALVEEATELVEEYLQRKLRFGTYTEELEIWDGAYAYPSVTPLVSVPGDVSYLVDSGQTRLRNVSVSPIINDLWYLDAFMGLAYGEGSRPHYAMVTYDGGYTPETCPRTIKRGVARATRALVIVNPQRIVGAQQITVGDVSVQYGKFTGDLEALVPGISLALKPYKRKRVRY